VLSVSLKIDKIEYRAVIKFIVKEGLTPNEIHSKIVSVCGDPPPSFSTIKKWAAEFKRGRTSLEVDPREGRPKVQQHQNSLNNMVLDVWRMKVREISETVGISKERLEYILHEELDMKSFAQDGCRACSQQIKMALT
jgi:transposase